MRIHGLLEALMRRHLAATSLMLLVWSSGCSLLPQIGGEEAAERAQESQALQAKVMRFADEYVGRLSNSLDVFQAAAPSAAERLDAQSWKVSQATSAYAIGSGASPVASALDFVVLATLSRMVIEDLWVGSGYGERARRIYDMHRDLETLAWALVDGVLDEDQQLQLRATIDHWRSLNPDVRAVAYIHFADFAQSIEQPERRPDASLLALVGLDPLENLDPAVRELAQTRQLAERAMYYAQRAPNLLDMQIERLTYQLAVMPETREVLADIERASRAVQQAGDLAGALPAVVAREREAAIDQFMTALFEQQQQTSALVTELRDLLEAGTVTSESLTATIRSLDSFMARIKPTDGSSPQTVSPAKSFDIAEYTEAAREFAMTARELEALIRTLDSNAPAVTAAVQDALAGAQDLVDYVFWRAAALLVLLIVLLFVAAVAFRAFIARRGRS
jgi:hypothetical protein